MPRATQRLSILQLEAYASRIIVTLFKMRSCIGLQTSRLLRPNTRSKEPTLITRIDGDMGNGLNWVSQSISLAPCLILPLQEKECFQHYVWDCADGYDLSWNWQMPIR